MKSNIQKGLLTVVALVSVGAANAASAAIDVTATTQGITDAQTALLSVIGGLVSLSVALFGISKVYAFIKRKAGA
ncbi:major capsid protein [Duganella sp. HH101]|uniref:major capsid protein n=1 Tax=Duganella sp. HH101 TaxID=1781066 RepID=UPI0008759034|nr:major capsid protein [Duganella sp. HH101]OFA02622.1 hypothetical protein DUGA2_34720 [Duganella sp. HH101]